MNYLKFLFAALLFFVQPLTAQTPEELKSWLPEIKGWIVSDDIEVFNPENLFDRINGAAPLFLENNFREMTSLEYKKGADYITIQAYRHATPEDAFGMYASERSSELQPLPIGGEAQGDQSSLFFFAGNVYVKMWSYSSDDEEETLQTIAEGLAKKIDPKAAYPVIVRAFPDDGKIPYSVAYVTANYIGHEFLKSVYTANYQRGETMFQLFVMDAQTVEGAKEVLDKFFSFTKQPLEYKQGDLLIKDRYNGDIPSVWKGRYIMGVFSEKGEAVENTDLLKELADRLNN